MAAEASGCDVARALSTCLPQTQVGEARQVALLSSSHKSKIKIKSVPRSQAPGAPEANTRGHCACSKETPASRHLDTKP